MTKSILKTILCLVIGFLLSSFTKEDKYLIQWDFTKFKKLTYEVTQSFQMKTNDSLGFDEPNIGKMMIEITVKDKEFADISIKYMNLETIKGRKVKEFNELQMPELSFTNLQKNGNFEGLGSKDFQIIFQNLFPVINSPLAINDTLKIAQSYPFSIQHNPIEVKGFNTVKLNDFQDSEYQITTSLNYNKYSIPKDFPYIPHCYKKGAGTFKFDSKKGCFTEGTILDTVYFKTTSKKEKDFGRNRMMESITKMQYKLSKIR